MLKKIILVIIFVVVLLQLNISTGESEVSPQSFNTIQELTNKLYQEVKVDNFQEAKSTIQSISKEITNVRYGDQITVEGMDALADTIIETKRNLAAIKPNSDNILYSTIRLYLAVDSLTHQKQPLWLGYYNLLIKDIKNQSILDYKNHYDLIKPAMLVSNKSYFIEKIDSIIVALVNNQVDDNKDVLLLQLKDTTREAFHGSEQETWSKVMKESTIYESSLGMGLIIFLVLTYVSWRKFRGAYLTH